jgi:hypothetical protein
MTNVIQYCDDSRDILLRSVTKAREPTILLLYGVVYILYGDVYTVPDHIPHANPSKYLAHFGNKTRKVNTDPHYWYTF